ncbi:hypothetical protein BH23GEM8_BH23GEM8_01120 [soil metagenome]
MSRVHAFSGRLKELQLLSRPPSEGSFDPVAQAAQEANLRHRLVFGRGSLAAARPCFAGETSGRTELKGTG